MSTPSRAEELADQFHDAVASIKTRLGRVVESAEQLDGLLWETEKELRGLPARPQGTAAEGSNLTVAAAGSAHGAEINRSLRDSQERIAEVRDGLSAAAAALTQAERFLDELENMPDAPVDAERRASMRQRLTDLDAAITRAEAGAGRTGARLDAARGNVAQIVPVYGEVRNRSVEPVYRAGEALTKDLSGIQAGLGTASAAHNQAVQSTEAAEDLAKAVRAAANPTPASAQQAPASSSEQDRRDRAGTTPRGPQLNQR